MNHRYGILLVLLFAACKGKDISGVYVRPINHEFARGTDTLRIRALKGNRYTIIENQRFQRLRNSRFMPFEKSHKNYPVTYDAQNDIAQLPDGTPIRFLFMDDCNTLVMGATTYRKVSTVN
ncbi:hypothetical protein [Niabella terrae]